MVTDNQVKRLFALMEKQQTVQKAASMSGMDEKTARKYLRNRMLPSDTRKKHDWQTRTNPFEAIWSEVITYLELNPGLEGKFLFEHFQRTYPKQFQDGQLRTFQRKIKHWKATQGPPKQVFFAQKHYPGELCQSDFTDMSSLAITINRRTLAHLVYHFVLTYSNWEAVQVCYSESFESLSSGLQYAIWKLGGVPRAHRTDRLSAAVYSDFTAATFTKRYQNLLDHYGIAGQKTSPRSPQQNGDIEQRHYRFKRAVDQSLMLRGSRDFNSMRDYTQWLDRLIEQLNFGRLDALKHEREVLGSLPAKRIDAFKRLRLRVGPHSTIRVAHNTYSVDSRLIGEHIDVHLHSDHLQIWYGQKQIDRLPRLRGEDGHRIAYRHVIDSLVRKPAAFENFRYRQDLFPTHRFRLTYDYLRNQLAGKADKAYLQILHLAARQNESAVDQALHMLLEGQQPIDVDIVGKIVDKKVALAQPTEVRISGVELSSYDQLLSHAGGLL